MMLRMSPPAEAAPGLWFGPHAGLEPKPDVVVCLSSHDSCPALRTNTLMVRLPLQDGQVPPPPELEDLTKLISSLLDEDKIVRVACDLGLNRSGLVAARVLIERGMTAEDAIRQVRSVRRGALGSDPAGLFRKAGLAYAGWLMSR